MSTVPERPSTPSQSSATAPSITFSSAARTGTKQSHAAIEAALAPLVSASITISTYVRYLVALRELYVVLEAALADNCDHPALRPIFNPRVLCRVPGLDADIQFYTDMLTSSGGKVYTPPHPSTLPQPLHTYTTYIKDLSVTAPHMLLAHAYVRYLGDMSGGREIRRIIEKHFLRNVSTGVTEDRALDDLGCGLAFYRFEPLEPPAGAPREANATEIRQIKVWFRHGMDVGAGADEAMIHALVDEANRAFEMNSDALKGIVHEGTTKVPGDTVQERLLDKKDVSVQTLGVEVPSAGRGYSHPAILATAFIAFVAQLFLIQWLYA